MTFPQRSALLLTGPPGIGKFEYCLDLVKEALSSGTDVIYVTTERSPEEVASLAGNYGIDLGGMTFVDCYSWSIAGEGRCELCIKNPGNLNEVYSVIEKAAKRQRPPVRIVFDSLSPLFLHNPEDAILKFVQLLSSKVKKDYGAILYIVQDGVHNPRTVNALAGLLDGLIEMKFVEGETLGRRMRVHHLKGASLDASWVPFTIGKKGFRQL